MKTVFTINDHKMIFLGLCNFLLDRIQCHFYGKVCIIVFTVCADNVHTFSKASDWFLMRLTQQKTSYPPSLGQFIISKVYKFLIHLLRMSKN